MQRADRFLWLPVQLIFEMGQCAIFAASCVVARSRWPFIVLWTPGSWVGFWLGRVHRVHKHVELNQSLRGGPQTLTSLGVVSIVRAAVTLVV